MLIYCSLTCLLKPVTISIGSQSLTLPKHSVNAQQLGQPPTSPPTFLHIHLRSRLAFRTTAAENGVGGSNLGTSYSNGF